MTSTEIGRVTSSDGTSIAFERVGDGPAVILVDAAGNFRGFSPMPQLAEALSQNFTTFTFDRRQHRHPPLCRRPGDRRPAGAH